MRIVDQNLYHVTITGEGMKSKTSVRARNKVEAITAAMNLQYGWRSKDRIENIEITEDAGNRELDFTDYQTEGKR